MFHVKQLFDKDIKIFVSELKKWNTKINLISKNNTEIAISKNLHDSLALIPNIKNNIRLLDIGSGNGFPAIPIAIYRSDVNVYCTDSNIKKAIFIKNIKNTLNINNITILNNRFESKNKEYCDFFDAFTIKAVKITKKIVQNIFLCARKRASIFMFNSFKNNELSLFEQAGDKVINTVNKIVYNNFIGEKKEITEIILEKSFAN